MDRAEPYAVFLCNVLNRDSATVALCVQVSYLAEFKSAVEWAGAGHTKNAQLVVTNRLSFASSHESLVEFLVFHDKRNRQYSSRFRDAIYKRLDSENAQNAAPKQPGGPVGKLSASDRSLCTELTKKWMHVPTLEFLKNFAI